MKLLILILSITLASCASSPKIEYRTITKYSKVHCGQEPKSNKIKIVDVRWEIIKSDDDRYYIGLTSKDYENMASNTDKIKSSLGQKNAIILFYQSCINDHNSRVVE